MFYIQLQITCRDWIKGMYMCVCMYVLVYKFRGWQKYILLSQYETIILFFYFTLLFDMHTSHIFNFTYCHAVSISTSILPRGEN